MKPESKTVPIEQLEVWKDNPRLISEKDFARLKRQIQQFGQIKPLIVCPEDGHLKVYGGNMRIRAYQELGIKDVWVSVQKDLTEKEKIELSLVDNDRAGEFDDQKLAELIYPFKDEIKLEDFKVDLGKPIDLGMVLDRFGPTGEDDFDADAEAEKIGEPQSKRGEIYELGRHKLMCGDATSRKDVDKLMDGKKADMVFTDPPYGVNYGGGRSQLAGVKKSVRKIQNDNLSGESFREFIFLAFENINWFLKDNGVLYIWHGDAVPSFLIILDEFCKRWKHLNEIIWNKNCASLGYCDYRYRHECISYGSKNGNHTFYGDKTQVDVWDYSKGNVNVYEHPTQKPIGLSQKAISNSSQRDEIIQDLFGGSGSTLIACEQTDRICFMMEIDPIYCDVIRERYRRFVGEKPS
jgi:DNA modification methylase